MPRNVLVGLDVGTSSVKALFITDSGEVLDRIESKIHTNYEQSGYAEQDANEYWLAVVDIFERAGSLKNDVVSIGLSGQTPSVVCIDELGNPTYPVLIWQDVRASKEAEDLLEHFGNPVSTIGTSLPWSASACPAKLLWLARNEPDVVAKTRWVLQPKDYVGYKLTGSAISDPWSSKGLCNVLTREPIDVLFEFVGWNKRVTPELLDGQASRGKLTAAAVSELGLSSENIKITVGLSDAMCGMLAIGALTQDRAFIITGTSAIVGISTDDNVTDAAGLYVIPKSCSPKAVVYGPTQSSGASVAWVANLFGVSIDDVMDQAAKANLKFVPMYLPYISGERAPIWRTDIRGSFNLVDSAATESEFFAAVLEGISFHERSVLDVASSTLSINYSSITLGGHAGNDQRWDAIRLRTLGKGLERKTDIDSTTRGAAMLAMTNLGLELTQTVELLKPSSTLSSPDLDQTTYSEARYQDFLALRTNLLSFHSSRT